MALGVQDGQQTLSGLGVPTFGTEPPWEPLGPFGAEPVVSRWIWMSSPSGLQGMDGDPIWGGSGPNVDHLGHPGHAGDSCPIWAIWELQCVHGGAIWSGSRPQDVLGTLSGVDLGPMEVICCITSHFTRHLCVVGAVLYGSGPHLGHLGAPGRAWES